MRHKTMTKRILVIAAHPDDEILGCGATMSKHTRQEDEVWSLILGEGITSRTGMTEGEKKSALDKLQADARSANSVVRAKRLILEKFPDNSFDSVPLLTIIHAIEKITDEFMPDIIYTHHPGDVNIDHHLTFRAVEAVTRPMENSSINLVLAFEVASSTEWNFAKSNIFRPNFFNQIEKMDLTKKLKAMKSYQSEVREFPHPRSLKYLEAQAIVRGGQSGFLLAEAFQLIYKRVA